MQYYTPIPSGGQAHPSNPFSEAQSTCRPPQIIGEGEVASIVLPDGSIQLVFVPSPVARCTPGPLYPPYINQQQTPWNSPEAWVIRSAPDQFLAYHQNVSRQQFPPEISNPSFPQSRYQNRTGYQLKFHNDGCTSTTDIQYFDSIRPRGWFPRQSTATQASSLPSPSGTPSPPSEFSRLVSGQPCRCLLPCHCFNSYARSDQIQMLVGNFDHGKRLPISSDCQTSDWFLSVEMLQDKKQRKGTRFGDESNSEEWDGDKSNKGTVTIMEQATESCPLERETQTGCGAGVPVRRVDSFLHVSDAGAEAWYPVTAAARALYSDSENASVDGSGSEL